MNHDFDALCYRCEKPCLFDEMEVLDLFQDQPEHEGEGQYLLCRECFREQQEPS